MDKVNVIIKEDDSVQKMLNKKAKSLQSKYSKRRRISEKLLEEKTPVWKGLSIVLDVLCVMLVFFAGVVCFSGINSRIQNVCPTFAGYSNLTVKTGSMVASGFEVNSNIIVKSVNTKTLHKNDMIAFYVTPSDYNSFNINACQVVPDEEIGDTQFITTFKSLFGVQPTSIVEAAKANSQLVFHHIREVYQDEAGTRWFKTYGSSNTSDDVWFISENMVVGLYDSSSTASFFSSVISASNSRFGFLILLIPILMLGVIIVYEGLKAIARAKLELDCVEEKRRITDPICIKNDVGYGMSTKTKYKILAQATPENTNEYISLLWRNGSMPSNIRKYYLRRNILLDYNRKLLALNRKCEKMFNDGVSPTKIAKYYTDNKSKLEQQQIDKARQLRSMRQQ